MFLYAEKYLNKNTCENYLYEIKIFIKYVDITSYDDFTSVKFSSYFKFRESNSVKAIGTINNYIKSLKLFYEFLVFNKTIPTNIADKLEFIKPQKKIPNVLTCYDIHCIFESLQNSFTETTLRNIAIIETLYSTGIRINELINLKSNAHLNESASVIGKFNKERLILFSGPSKKKIETYLKAKKTKSLYLFSNLKGEKLSSRYINKMINDVCIEVGINFKVSAHTFRHTYASHMYEGGANIIEIQNLLGHSKVSTTEIYTTYVGVELLRKELQLRHPRW